MTYAATNGNELPTCLWICAGRSWKAPTRKSIGRLSKPAGDILWKV